MKERPIIFNEKMVQAILDGRKTQTRRIVKCDHQEMAERDDGTLWPWREDCEHGGDIWYPCPHGQPGDRLWVRETWQAIHEELNGDGYVDETTYAPSIPKEEDNYWHPVFAADNWCEDINQRGFPWRPAIHMPRWASRILLEITDVRVERLNAISEHDAQAEGVGKLRGGFWQHYQPSWTQHQLSARGSYVTLWKSIYGEESWNSNPWVWVIEFKRIEERAA